MKNVTFVALTVRLLLQPGYAQCKMICCHSFAFRLCVQCNGAGFLLVAFLPAIYGGEFKVHCVFCASNKWNALMGNSPEAFYRDVTCL